MESAPGVDHAFVLHDKSLELIAGPRVPETQHAVESDIYSTGKGALIVPRGSQLE